MSTMNRGRKSSFVGGAPHVPLSARFAYSAKAVCVRGEIAGDEARKGQSKAWLPIRNTR